MNALTQDRRQPGFDRQSQTSGEPDQPLPRRPRRQFLNRRSAALAAVVTCAVGFYAGVRVEKGQLASAPRTFTLGAGASGAAGGTRAGAGGASASAAGASGLASRFGAGRSATAGGAGASFGTVSSVNGKTLVVSEASGNTVKVHLVSSTKISKSQSVSRSAIRPGDTVVIAGVADKSGAISAATVTDSGAGSAGGLGAAFGGGAGGGAAAGARGSGSASGSGSAVGSLFSGGGGGG